MDEFQKLYEEHKVRKQSTIKQKYGNKKIPYKQLDYLTLSGILNNRRSQRVFNDKIIKEDKMKKIIESVRLSPSSCNRQAIYLKEADKDFAEEVLVGGKNWINNAYKVYLVFGDKIAYKNPVETSFMPYLDAGFVGQSVYLMCEVLGLGCCFVNPNIREENKQRFIDRYGKDYFCGAIAIGDYDFKSPTPPLRDESKVLRK